MRYTFIPDCDMRLSAICLGGVPLGSTLNEYDSFALLDTYTDAGGNFLDTAKVYADWLPGERSISEKTIGRWLRARGNRSKIYIGTKGAHPELGRMDVPRMSPTDIISDLTASLNHLQTDYIDLYWLHRDDPLRSVGEILDTLQEQVDRGKIRYFGCSNWSVDRIRKAREYAQEHGITGFIASQPMWSFARPIADNISDKTSVIMDEEGIRFHCETGMPVMPYSPQAHGFLSKLERRGMDGLDSGLKGIYGNVENIERLQRAQRIAHEYGTTVGTIALAFLMSQSFPVIPIIGAKTSIQLQDGLSATDLKLSEDTLAYLTGGEEL